MTRQSMVIAVLILLPLQGQVLYKDILAGAAETWLTYAGDYFSRRHSPLDQINRKNVESLVPVWVHNIEGARRLEVTPLVYDSIMYVTDSNAVEALDAQTGRELWRYRADHVKEQEGNRGVALLGDRIYFVTTDAHLVALHRTSGNLIWDHEIASVKQGYFTTMAPLAIKDRILVGVSTGGSGQRGFVAALAAETGAEIWRFWTVPGKGQPGSETWPDEPPQHGGAPTWTTGSYDPDLNLVYWPTGNPWPDFYGGFRRGDNLYSDSVVALDGDTGKLKWYFQFTPHDTHDWDANETPVLVDTLFRGRTRKLLLQANRNGFYYILDRTDGKFLAAKRFVEKLTWATGVGPNGLPMEAPNSDPTPAGNRVCPAVRGATNWMSPSYDPSTGLLYVVVLEQCDLYTSSAKEPVPLSDYHGTGGEQISSEPGQFYLRALNATTGERQWEFRMTGQATMWAGTVSTGGGLVFTGDDDGNLVALDARSGEDLWHFCTGHTLYASPMTFMLHGRQYVTIAAESDIFTFALFQEGVVRSKLLSRNKGNALARH